jgi:AcrR family transcriptional regulator
MTATVVHDLLPRIEAAAKAVRDSENLIRAERETRRRLVHAAADAGVSMRAIARALGGGTGLVSKILSTPDPDEE